MHYAGLLALCAAGAYAQSSTITSRASSTDAGSSVTVTVYGLSNTLNTYGASVVNADQAATTYNVNCIAGATLCPDDDFLLTQAATSIHLTNSGVTRGITYTEAYTCALSGTTSASCSYSLGASTGGQSTSTTIRTSYSTSRLPYATIIVTAGQEKLDGASTVPPGSGSGATSGSGSGGSGGGNAGSRATILGGTAGQGVWLIMMMAAGTSLACALVL